ncbi:MAG: hypothetical protein ACMUIL_11395 [bacterium]
MVEFKKFAAKAKKDNVNVLMYVDGYRILGTVYLPLGGRLTDFLNTKGLGAEGEIFIPVTDASIFSLDDGSLIHYTPFLNVNKDKILFIFPQEEITKEKGLDTKGKMP